MGGASTGGRTDSGQEGSTTTTKIGVGDINEKGKKTKSYKSKNPEAFRNTGAENIKNKVKKVPSPILNFLSIPLQHGSRVTRDFYVDKVLGSKNFKGQSKTSFLSMSKADQEKQYKSYISSRTAGKTDAYGNTINQNPGGGSNNNPILSTNTEATKQVASSGIVTNSGASLRAATPTIAEVSQATSTMMSDAEISVANKKKGRSNTILTKATGLGSSSSNTTKKTLGA